VPVAAAMGVLVRFAIEQYMHGRLYRGVEQDAPDGMVPAAPGHDLSRLRADPPQGPPRPIAAAPEDD
jgi:hypothetical protein